MAEAITNQRLAEVFVAEQIPYSLVYHDGQWHRYHRKFGWRVVPTEEVKSRITRFLTSYFDKKGCRDNGGRRDWDNLTDSRIRDVMVCVQSLLIVTTPTDDLLDPTLLLTKEEGQSHLTAVPAEGWLSTLSHHLCIPEVAVALYNGEPIPENAIQPASGRLFARGITPCVFNPAATCPRWEQFVDEVCPDDLNTFQMMAGLSLTHDRRYNVFFIIHGPTCSGKSVALKVLAKLSLGNTSGVTMKNLGERFEPYPLTENRLNIVYDMDAVTEGGSVSLRESILKSATCGEKVATRQLYMPSTLRPLRALLIFGSNEIPLFEGRGKAIPDRMRLIAFPNTFRDSPMKNLGLFEELCKELPGILVWALKGYGELLARGVTVFPESSSSAKIKDEAIKANRSEELFCDECLVKSDRPTSLATKEVYALYDRFCYLSGLPATSIGRVIPRICAYMGVEKKRVTIAGDQVMCLLGVRRKDSSSAIQPMQDVGVPGREVDDTPDATPEIHVYPCRESSEFDSRDDMADECDGEPQQANVSSFDRVDALLKALYCRGSGTGDELAEQTPDVPDDSSSTTSERIGYDDFCKQFVMSLFEPADEGGGVDEYDEADEIVGEVIDVHSRKIEDAHDVKPALRELFYEKPDEADGVGDTPCEVS